MTTHKDGHRIRIHGTMSLRLRLTLWFSVSFAVIQILLVLVQILWPAKDHLFITTSLSIVVISFVSWVIAGAAVKPFIEISEIAREVSPEKPGERIQLEESTPEIAQLQEDLNGAIERFEEGIRAQERFISNVAHDLNTPIAVIRLEAETIRKRRSVTTEDYDAFLGSAIDEMRRLGDLVDSFLMLARIERGQRLVQWDRVHVNDVLLDCLEHVGPLAELSGVSIDLNLDAVAAVDADLVVRGDAALLLALIGNLARNAIKFSPHGSTVIIAVAVDTDRGELELSVRDFGPGIPEDAIDTIFDRYRLGPQTHARTKGTGLGLAIARSVADLHRGSIRVENCQPDQGEGTSGPANESGAGCRFIVRIPLEGHDLDDADHHDDDDESTDDPPQADQAGEVDNATSAT